jgi:hypothetical protein
MYLGIYIRVEDGFVSYEHTVSRDPQKVADGMVARFQKYPDRILLIDIEQIKADEDDPIPVVIEDWVLGNDFVDTW